MLHKLLRQYGVARLAAGLTLVSVLLSVLITSLVGFVLSDSGPGLVGLTIAVVVPLIIAPVMSLQMLRLLHQLDLAEVRLRTLSITDDLTQSHNRRHFISLAEAELARVRRYGGQCALAILDLDNFKDVNDNHGHLAGDDLLRGFADLCRQHLRAADTFARYGGDEFVMLLPGTAPQAAREVVDRIRAMLAAPGANGAARPITLSAGIAALDASTTSLDQLIKEADDALYAAKRTGGNQVIVTTAK